MKIFIDGIEADIDERTNISISLSVALLSQPGSSRIGYSKTIELPMTMRNREIMLDGEQLNSSLIFNQNVHYAKVESEGCVLMEGPVFLKEANAEPGRGYYRVVIMGGGKEWVDFAAATQIRYLDVDFEETFNGEMIRNSWTWQKPVRFLPVYRQDTEIANFNEDLLKPVKILTPDDYHPFIHIKTLLERMFAATGYSIDSEFVNGYFFNSLYMSGNYPVKDVELHKSRVDFRAGRFASATAVADINGRVYADPYRTVNSIGNIVQSANPNETVGGVKIEGVYTVGDCFRSSLSHVEFVPPYEVTAGFEYTIYYSTDYYMLSSTEVGGFNRINLGEQHDHTFVLPNKNENRRNSLEPNISYNIIVFGYEQGSTYQFRYDEVTNPYADINDLKPSDYTTQLYGMFSSRVKNIIIQTTNRIVNAKLSVRRAGDSLYRSYTGDWAIYDGYVSERGTMDVGVVLRSVPETISPSRPKVFHRIYFGGAQQGMTLRISNKTTVRPIFASGIGEGSSLDFQSIAATGASCLDLVNALKQMFNLYFYTDSLSKKVYIEPQRDFYRNDVVVDMTGRVDTSKPIVVTDVGNGMAANITFGYGEPDKATAKWNVENGQRLGAWTTPVANTYTSYKALVYENPVFSPSVSEEGLLENCLSASLMRIDGGIAGAAGGLNFSPRIVRYVGMVPLPESQQWGWPSHGNTYPLAGFHYRGIDSHGSGLFDSENGDTEAIVGGGFSLCFEDRDSIEGLHRYWDGNVGMYDEGKRVELYLLMYPEEMERLLRPNRMMQDFRALYRININGESNIFRLEQVCDYNPSSKGLVKCVFIKIF